MPQTLPPPTLLARTQWQARAAAHTERAEGLTAGHRARRDRGERHAIDDFLWQYYNLKPSALHRWHPGWRTALEGAAEHLDGQPGYRCDGATTQVDLEQVLPARQRLLDGTVALLAATASRPPAYHCFGGHEWAMVYGLRGDDRRHPLPLRLGQAGTDAVVEQLELRCTHFDAYRFFTPAAAPRNDQPLTRQRQVVTEQPGCLHAGMDLYKHAFRLLPLVPSDLVLRCLEHASAIRVLDMRASPYDVSGLGHTAVPIETSAGRAEYVRQQRALAETSAVLRAELLSTLRPLASADGETEPGRSGGTGPATC